MKVKCFESACIGLLEEWINKFFGENNITLIDVRYSSCYKSGSHVIYSAMVIYREDNQQIDKVFQKTIDNVIYRQYNKVVTNNKRKDGFYELYFQTGRQSNNHRKH